jgi:hypothetical protein
MKLEDMFITLGNPTFKVYNTKDGKKKKKKKKKNFFKKDFK